MSGLRDMLGEFSISTGFGGVPDVSFRRVCSFLGASGVLLRFNSVSLWGMRGEAQVFVP